MKNRRVLVTRRWPGAVESRIADLFDASFNAEDRQLTTDELADALTGFDAILTTVTDRLDSDLLSGDRQVNTRFIGNFGVGFSHIDINAARRTGIVVTNTPDVLSECTADLAMTLLLMVARRAGEGERELRAGNWTGWRPTHMIGQKVTGKTLGIIGFGRIGRQTARRAHFGFGMKIIAQNRSPIDQSFLDECSATQAETIEELLESADFVSLHCPGGDANRHLINAERLALMKPTAYLVNTARGEVVDEDALAEALKSKSLAGAGLDVFDGEPEIRKGLLECENAVLLPHLGSSTRETRDAMGHRVIDNLVAFFEGREPNDRVV